MDTGEWRRLDEPVAVTDIDEDDQPRPSRLALARDRWLNYVIRHGRRGAVIGLGITFVLLLASQWMAWATVTPQSTPTSVVDSNGNPEQSLQIDVRGTYDVGINDANTAMTLTYHLMWVIVLALAGATVFASRRSRQPLFGATIGAIVVQFVAILPLLRHPKGLIVNAISEIAAGSGATELIVTRGAGMFCAVAALIVLAGSMVFAVQGNVLPSFAADEEGAEPFAGTPEFAPDPLDVDLDVDIEVLPEQSATSDGHHSAPPAIDTPPEPHGQPDVVAFTVEAVEGLPDHPDVPPSPASDHSAYARPLGNEDYRR